MTSPYAAPYTPDAPWERLDPRMLLVHPIKEVLRFIPVLIGLVLAGGLADGPWALIGLGIPVGVGVVRFVTTTYRVTDARVELRRGLLQRHVLATPLERVRTVDLTASPIHRVLGLATLVIGTGSAGKEDEDRLKLDSLPREQAAALRRRLLGGLQPTAAQTTEDTAPTAVDTAPTGPDEDVVARFEPRWLWYAPFTGTVFVAAGAAFGASGPFLDKIRFSRDEVSFFTPSVVITLVVVLVLVVIPVLFVAGYLITNGGFVLSRGAGAWHIRRGLLTHRETSIDIDRLAGVVLDEAALLRLARGRRLQAIVTGLRGSGANATVLVPPSPQNTSLRAAEAVLGTAEPIDGALLPHGRRATTRRHTRALLGAAPLALAPLVAVLAGAPAYVAALAVLPVLVALGLAADRARSLGHAHLADHVVMRSGSVLRRREVLADAHVIGWTMRATWFQRRAGLTSVAATTAGGSGRIEVRDVPVGADVSLARAATPGLLEEFLVDV